MKRLLLTAVSVWTLTSSAAREVEVSVDWDRPRGAIREVNSVGQPPVTGWVGTNMFHHLEKIGAKYSLVLGDNEIAENKAKVKNMESGEQTELTLDETFAEKFSVLTLTASKGFEI